VRRHEHQHRGGTGVIPDCQFTFRHSSRSPTPVPVPATATGSWRSLPAMPAGYWQGRTSVWTGSQMIIHTLRFGPGTKITSVTLGCRPATNSWQRLAPGPQPANLQTSDVAVWTGSEMLIPRLTNGAYNPATSTWRRGT
jgi:hypothetical protein